METSELSVKGKSARSLNLIAKFVYGYAEGWKMAVSENFKDELDIKLTKRVIDKKNVDILTQGSYYNFKEGHILYDTPKAYTIWHEAIKNINIACKIIKAKPRSLSTKENNSAKRTIDDGLVVFLIYKPNENRTVLQEISEHEMTQVEFVNFLKTGFIDDHSGTSDATGDGTGTGGQFSLFD